MGNRLAHALVTVLIAASLPVLLAHSASAASAPGQPCTDVQFIGLRGSGEPNDPTTHGMGSLIGSLADQAAALAPNGTTISFYGLPYEAGDASIVTVLDQKYFASEHEGRDLLKSYLSSEVAACPSTKLVIMGYSQGAHAAGDALNDVPSTTISHIYALILMADPRFNPDLSYVNGSFDPRDHGLAGPRAATEFKSLQSRTGSWCRRNDLICQGLGKGHSSGQHAGNLYLSEYGSVVGGFIRKKMGWPFTKPNSPLDLAYVIDSTGSMGSSIDGARAAAAQTATTLSKNGSDFRVGLVDYKDVDQGDPYAARVDTQFTPDITKFQAGLDSLSADGGGDTPEAVYSGIMTAIQGLSWRHGARKVIILMGDAPGKDPEPVTGYTRQSVLQAAYDLDPAIIDTVPISGGPGDFFTGLADGTGGQEFPADDASTVSDQLIAAVSSAAVPLVAALSVGTPVRPGLPARLSAAGSSYDTGDIARYDWDFDGDGSVDLTTKSPLVDHTYGAAGTYAASVTVVSADGHSATAQTDVVVSPDAPVAANAPRNLSTNASSPGSIVVTWDSPTGATAGEGYVVSVTDTTSGEPIYVTTTTDDARSASITGLAPGTYRVEVWQVNEAGEGAHAAATAVLGLATHSGADIKVSLSAPRAVHPAQVVSIAVTLSNSGPQAAKSAYVAVLVPSGWSVASVTGVQRLSGRVVLRATGDIQPGSAHTWRLSATVGTKTGSVLIGAAGVSTTRDPHLANNVATVAVVVAK